MKKFKLDKKMSTRIAALCTAGIMMVTMSACSKKKQESKPDYSNEISIVSTMEKDIDSLIPGLNEDVKDDASIILLLDVLAKADENGKISADVISNFKSKINSDNMIDQFNSFLDVLEDSMIKNGEVEKVSTILPEELNNDKAILSKLETILENIIKYTKENNKNSVVSEFDKIYDLFVNENTITIDGLKFKVRDLTYSSREVANTYAETAAYYAKGFVNEDKLKAVDERTNDQNSKAYIKSKLEILNNQMTEKSETDVIKLFYDTYAKLETLEKGKLTLTATGEKELVNYLNMRYLDSSKVATKDKKTLLGDYEENKVSEALISIDAIDTYNQKNQKDIIPYSSLLVSNYSKTESGKVDSLALDFVQFNSIKLLNTVNENTTYDELLLNPYYKNLYKYITKQNLVHTVKDSNGNLVNNDIVWQEISDGVNFVNYEVILSTLNKISYVKEVSINGGIIDKAKMDLSESILYIQSTITGECQKTDTKEFVKTK